MISNPFPIAFELINFVLLFTGTELWICVYGIDIFMRHDSSRAFGYAFTRASAAKWTAIKDAAMKQAEPYLDGEALKRKIGKDLNEVEITLLLSGKGAVDADEATLEDVEQM